VNNELIGRPLDQLKTLVFVAESAVQDGRDTPVYLCFLLHLLRGSHRYMFDIDSEEGYSSVF